MKKYVLLCLTVDQMLFLQEKIFPSIFSFNSSLNFDSIFPTTEYACTRILL